MTENQEHSMGHRPPTPRWRLWVDGCGGFLIIGGDKWTVGGPGASHNGPGAKRDSATDVSVQADWPREAGTIRRNSDVFFWTPLGTDAESHAEEQSASRMLLTNNQTVPIAGSASMVFSKPSPLSHSAVLSLKPPHRFLGHVDKVILAENTILVGPTPDCAIRCLELDQKWTLVWSQNRWMAKRRESSEWIEFSNGNRTELDSVAMTLEVACAPDFP